MEFRQNKSIYMQISDYICEKILLKEWDEGNRIPSVREMAVGIEVNPNTVQRSYSYLQDQKIIFIKRGIGYFVAENANERTMLLRKDNFIQDACPPIFHEMELLQLGIEDFDQIYQDWKKEKENIEGKQ